MAKSRAHEDSFRSTDTPRTAVSAGSCPQRPQLSPTCVSHAPNAVGSALPCSPPPLQESGKSPSKRYPPPPRELRPDYLRGRVGREKSCRETKSHGPDERNDRSEAVIRRDYRLGDLARSPSHMVVEPNPKRATAAVDAMRDLDFAFVKRSDGSWTYAVLAKRSEDSMLFVVDRTSRTLLIDRSEWGRRVRPPAASSEEESVEASAPTARLDEAPRRGVDGVWRVPETTEENVAASRQDEAPRRGRRGSRSFGPGDDKLERYKQEFHHLLRDSRPPAAVSFRAQEDDAVSCLSEPIPGAVSVGAKEDNTVSFLSEAPRELAGERSVRGADPVLCYYC